MTHQRDVAHGVHDHALVLFRVLGDTPEARLGHVIAIGLLRAGLQQQLTLDGWSHGRVELGTEWAWSWVLSNT